MRMPLVIAFIMASFMAGEGFTRREGAGEGVSCTGGARGRQAKVDQLQ